MSTVTIAESPIGPLTIGATDHGVRFVMWHDDQRPIPEAAQAGTQATVIVEATRWQLEEYFRGERTEFDLPLDPVGTPFQHAAWEALRTIAYGSTISYGEQARRLGDARKARAVGAANGRNLIGIIVPCHRVVGANGSLTGFAGGLASKAWLLDHERRVLASALISARADG
ncbi:MAG: methylated-DNA--protein-cysteine methyltransferase [Actinomycetota bacterium]